LSYILLFNVAQLHHKNKYTYQLYFIIISTISPESIQQTQSIFFMVYMQSATQFQTVILIIYLGRLFLLEVELILNRLTMIGISCFRSLLQSGNYESVF